HIMSSKDRSNLVAPRGVHPPEENPYYNSAQANEKTEDESNQSYISNVKDKIQGAVHTTAQKLNLEPRERNPEAAHQDAKTNPE
ncbi:11760_t:CDS:1, partial [Acaulospora colombiana]